MVFTLIFENCTRDSKIETVEWFINARNSLNFEDISKFLSDGVTEIEGELTLRYSRSDFYTKFQWLIVKKQPATNNVLITLVAKYMTKL